MLIRGFLLVISALVVGAFFTVWTIQRSGDIAVLKALGASAGTLMRDALGQAAVVLLLGSVVGVGDRARCRRAREWRGPVRPRSADHYAARSVMLALLGLRAAPALAYDDSPRPIR